MNYFSKISNQFNGGAEENRTPDPLRAKQVLSQLSYGPFCFGFSLMPHYFLKKKSLKNI